MPVRKQPRITNIWSKVVENKRGDLFSRVVIESTGAMEYRIKNRGCDVALEISGAVANMPEGLIAVEDGLVREVSLAQTGPETALVEIKMDHPARYAVEVTDGIPAWIVVTLDRTFLKELFNGKVIVIDPGHGGEDPGGRGPVNLLEKNVVMPISQNLLALFEKVGARALLTRTTDENISPSDRAKIAIEHGADLLISLHTHSHRDHKVSGLAVLYNSSHRESLDLAKAVNEELMKKLKLPSRGLFLGRETSSLRTVPALEVEVVTITNWVEEGLLRSPTFHKKAAEGIFNGIKKYYANAVRHEEV